MIKKELDLLTNIMDTSSCSMGRSEGDEEDEEAFFSSEDFEVVDASDCDIDIPETKDNNFERMEISEGTMEAQQEQTEENREIALCDGSQLAMSSQQNRMRVALGVLIRLVVPLCNGFVRGWRGIRGVRLLKALRNIRASRQTLTNMLAFAANTISMSLSSVQVVHRIDPILKIIKLRKGPAIASGDGVTEGSSRLVVHRAIKLEPEEPEKCVTLNVLAEPPPGTPIRADIVFIHGLHGSLVNTWKQGLWKSEGRRVKFERPPRPPIRPPKRPRHSRSTLIRPPHLRKRARYCGSSDNSGYSSDDEYVLDEQQKTHTRSYTFEAGKPNSVEFCDDVEYSFPTFRLREEDRRDRSPSPGFIHSTNDKHKHTDPSEDQEKWSPCWPGDWLPLDCPGVRVIAVNYTTDPYLWRPVWVKKRNRSSLSERAREMTDLLIEKRVGYGHPIVWVGHSKGGIFIKQILIDAWESGRPAAAPLWRFSRGVFFYSVPHRGSPLADFNLPLLRQSIELTEIQKECPGILELHKRFLSLYQSGHLKIDVFSFVETALTLMSVLYLRIVGIDSADPGIGEVCGVHLDHREICKPRSRKCILYTALTRMINKVS